MKLLKTRQNLGKLLFLWMLVLCLSCQKDNNVIPYVQVNEYLNLTLPSNLDLNIVNGWIYYPNTGYSGLLIVNVDGVNYAAFDRACTHDFEDNLAIIQAIDNTVFAVDSLCGSRYSILDGSVSQGPATLPLKRYRTEMLNNNTLHIFN